MTQLLSGLVLFIGVHSISVVAWRWRDRVVERIGLAPWQGIFALISITGLVLIVTGYSELRGRTEILYLLPRWVHAVHQLPEV